MTAEEQLVLVEAVRRGDAQAFERLHAMLRPILRRAVQTIVPPDDVDDAVQEAMFRIFRKIASFQGDSAFSTWAVTVAKNTALMLLRKRKSEKVFVTQSIDETYEDTRGVSRTIRELGYEDRTVEQNEAREIIHAGLAKVGENERIAILMQMNGETIETIAETLDKGIPATKSILMRGKRALAAMVLNPDAEPRRNVFPSQQTPLAISAAS